MKEAMLDLINQILAEHTMVRQNTEDLEKTAHDVDLASQLEAAKGKVAHGEAPHQSVLSDLNTVMDRFEGRLKVHFDREEALLKDALNRPEGQPYASSIEVLRVEHAELMSRIAQLREKIAEVNAPNLSPDARRHRASALRVFLAQTRSLLEDHADRETLLFEKIRNMLSVQ